MVGVRVGVRVWFRVRVRDISLRDSFSVLLRPQHHSIMLIFVNDSRKSTHVLNFNVQTDSRWQSSGADPERVF